MLFSIIVPIYNTSNTLRTCLDSILQQSFYDYEVILINDGSTDNSETIALEYTSQYSNFKLYTFENGGVSVARKRGITLANGIYVIFVDSDDTINPDLLQHIANVINIHPGLEVIRYQSNLINDDLHKNHERYNFHQDLYCILSGIDALKVWSSPNIKYAVYWLFALKRDLFSSICLMPDIRCYEDLAYIPIIVASAKMVTTIGYHGYNYLCNRQDSLTNTINKDLQRERAYDFYSAYKFAISNFIQIKDISSQDIIFFVADYRRRLRSFFYSLDIDLRQELSPIYHLSVDET